jgi:hypothetical protein
VLRAPRVRLACASPFQTENAIYLSFSGIEKSNFLCALSFSSHFQTENVQTCNNMVGASVWCRRALHNSFITAVSLGFLLFRLAHPLAPRWTTQADSDQVVQRVFNATLLFHGYLAVNALTYMCRTLRSRVTDSFAVFFHTRAIPEFLDHVATLGVLVAMRPVSITLAMEATNTSAEVVEANIYRVDVYLHLTWLPGCYWLFRAVINCLIKPHHGTDLGNTSQNIVVSLFVASGGFYALSAITQSFVLYWSYQKHINNKSLASWDLFSSQRTADHVFLGLFLVQVLLKYLWIARAVKFVCKLFQPDTTATSRFGLFARRRQQT